MKVVLFPDAGPIITLAYAQALDLMLAPGWQVCIADMVLHELTRNATPTSAAVVEWVELHKLRIVATNTLSYYRQQSAVGSTPSRKAHLGELAIQEIMNSHALTGEQDTGIFLFEDHRIASASFLVPENCRKISTRAFLTFLEETGAITSAIEIERRAVQRGQNFSQLRFPPD